MFTVVWTDGSAVAGIVSLAAAKALIERRSAGAIVQQGVSHFGETIDVYELVDVNRKCIGVLVQTH